MGYLQFLSVEDVLAWTSYLCFYLSANKHVAAPTLLRSTPHSKLPESAMHKLIQMTRNQLWFLCLIS